MISRILTVVSTAGDGATTAGGRHGKALKARQGQDPAKGRGLIPQERHSRFSRSENAPPAAAMDGLAAIG